MWTVLLKELAAAIGITLAIVAGVLWNYYQYEAIKHDPVYALTFIVNVVIVLTTAIWSYKSFGQDMQTMKREIVLILAKQGHNDREVTNIYGYLREFGSRLRKLDEIDTDVERVDQEVFK